MIEWENLPEHTMGDVIDGVLYVNDPPNTYHQRANIKLLYWIMNHIIAESLGEVFPMETGVFIDDKNVFQPDLLFIANENKKAYVLKRGVYGPPDLVLEILSPSTRKKDKTIKRDFFERIGVREYWIVDPETKDSYGYFLENEKYSDPVHLNSKIHVRIFDKTFDF